MAIPIASLSKNTESTELLQLKHQMALTVGPEAFLRQQQAIPLKNTGYNARTRSWYQAAVREKHLIWTDIYQFHLFAGSDYSLPGITAALPVYNARQQLMGILGIDLTIDQLIKFIISDS